MQDKAILRISEKAKSTSERAILLQQAVDAREELDNKFLLEIGQHVAELRRLAQELEDEVIDETSERRILAADVANSLKISQSTVFGRWRKLKRK